LVRFLFGRLNNGFFIVYEAYRHHFKDRRPLLGTPGKLLFLPLAITAFAARVVFFKVSYPEKTKAICIFLQATGRCRGALSFGFPRKL
jgi:hypothetical protein